MFQKNQRTLFLSVDGEKILSHSFKDFKEQLKKAGRLGEPTPLIEYRKDRSIPTEHQVGYKVGDVSFYAYIQHKIKLPVKK